MLLFLFSALFSPSFAANCNASWSEQDRRGILGVHNNLRSKIARGIYSAGGIIKGPASDMLQMEYDCGLEESAQRVADICPAKEAGSTENVHWRYSNTWMNLAGQGVQAAKKWERELQDHGWSSTGSQSGIERATKMAWSRTSKVGCGVKQCQQGQVVVVCHYSPEGNIKGENVYTPGQMCSVCPPGTSCNQSIGLCTTEQGQGNIDQSEDEEDPGNDLNGIMETFQHRFDNSWVFQHAIDSILKRWGPMESKWKVWKVPTFRKFWKNNGNVFDRWINCRKGQATGTEWNDGAFRFRCEADGSTRFMGCIASDGSIISDGSVKTVGAVETTCRKHLNGTMTREIVNKQGGSYHDIQQLTRNDESWPDKGLIKERKGNRIIIGGRRVTEQPTIENRTTASLDFELSEQCGQPLSLGYNGACNQRSEIMWYMDKETLTCLAFKYTGCGGNRNRFATKDECQRTCLPSDFQSCPANSRPVARADNTSHCITSSSDRLDCPHGSVCKMGYGAGLCCDAEISRRVDANYEPSCGRGKKVYKSWQYGTKLIHLGKSCSHNFCPHGASCRQGDYFAYCCL